MTDILKLNYHELRKNARIAKEDFANILSAARDQYDKLWQDHLKLLEICESSYSFEQNGDIRENSFTFWPCSTIQNKKKDENERHDSIVEENLSDTLIPNLEHDTTEHVIREEDTAKSSTSKSPVFFRKSSKLKKIMSSPDRFEEKLVTNVSTEIPSAFTNNHINQFPLKSIENDIIDVRDSMDRNNKNSSPSKLPSKTNKLGFSVLYNVDTKISNTGKKVKQSKLIFQPIEKRTDISSISLPEQNLFNSTNVNDVITIEDLGKKTNTRTALNDKNGSSCSSNKNLSTKTLNKSRLNIPIRTISNSLEIKHEPSQTIEDFSPLKKKLAITREKIDIATPKSHRDISIVSPDLFEIYNSHSNSISTGNDPSVRSKQPTKPTSRSYFGDGDETYFPLAEELGSQMFKNNINNTKSQFEHIESPPVKRALITSFDVIPPKNQKEPNFPHKTKTIRNKAERAKLNGWDCSDCKKFYQGMGLSKEELQMRKNQCSRHRARYNERACTPEGFWNPVFPDTVSSFRND